MIIRKRRRQEGRTDYRARLEMLKSEKTRIIIRKTNRYIIIQAVESNEAQDKVILYINSIQLVKYGWPEKLSGGLKNLAAAYLSGYLFGKKFGKKEAIIDTGLARNVPNSRIYAVVKGLIDAGVKLSCNEEILPKMERIKSSSKNAGMIFDKIKEKIENA